MIKHVGSVIKEQRISKGMTKSFLAKQLNCSPQNIDSLEARKSIDFELAQRLSLILGFDIFDEYRVYKEPKIEQPDELTKNHHDLKERYTLLLEKYNKLLESHVDLLQRTGLKSSDYLTSGLERDVTP